MNIPDIEQETGERIIRYLHGEIRGEEAEDLYRWIQAAPENRALFFQLKEVYDVMSERRSIDAGSVDASWERMQARLMARTDGGARPRRKAKSVVMMVMGYVAVAAVALVAGWRMNVPEVVEPTPVSRNEFIVGKGGRPDCVLLADGTVIRLNAGSRLVCPTVFADSVREVELDGEAWFDVARDEVKPFVVRLQRQRVIVHGTSFNVQAYGNEASSAVTLASGSITLETCRGNGQRLSSIMLGPGERAFFDREKETVSVEKTDTTLAGAWVRGEYKFRDEPLELIVRRLAGHYDVDIRLDEELKGVRYTGTFSFEQTVEQALRVINHERMLNFSRSGNTVFVTRKKANVKPDK
jgi:ferric-dicitrate binding protein FerR (iron transport regulator)